MESPPNVVIVLDFDGVLHDHDGSTNVDPSGAPVAHSIATCYELQERGYKLIVSTSRGQHGPEYLDGVRAWLRKHKYPDMEVTGSKPIGALYVDDRGFRFGSPESWHDLLSFLDRFPVPDRWRHPPSPQTPHPHRAFAS